MRDSISPGEHYGQVNGILLKLGLPHTWTAVRAVEAYLLLFDAGARYQVDSEQLAYMLAAIALAGGNPTINHLLTLLAASAEHTHQPGDALTEGKEKLAQLRSLYRAKN